jgi:hypothetical protein
VRLLGTVQERAVADPASREHQEQELHSTPAEPQPRLANLPAEELSGRSYRRSSDSGLVLRGAANSCTHSEPGPQKELRLLQKAMTLSS